MIQLIPSKKRFDRDQIRIGTSLVPASLPGNTAALLTYFEQKLCDLKMSVGARVMKRNEAAVKSQIRVKDWFQPHRIAHLTPPSSPPSPPSLTLCPSRGRQRRAGGGAARCVRGCTQQPGGAAWTGREDGWLDGRSGGCRPVP